MDANTDDVYGWDKFHEMVKLSHKRSATIIFSETEPQNTQFLPSNPELFHGIAFPSFGAMAGRWSARNEKSTMAAIYTSGNQVNSYSSFLASLDW